MDMKISHLAKINFVKHFHLNACNSAILYTLPTKVWSDVQDCHQRLRSLLMLIEP